MAKEQLIYGLQDKLRFGKYRGWMLQDVLTCAGEYVEWCVQNISDFAIDEAAWEYALKVRPALSKFYTKHKRCEGKYYSDGVEVLTFFPWPKQYRKSLKQVAEDVSILPLKCTSTMNMQLDLFS